MIALCQGCEEEKEVILYHFYSRDTGERGTVRYCDFCFDIAISDSHGAAAGGSMDLTPLAHIKEVPRG